MCVFAATFEITRFSPPRFILLVDVLQCGGMRVLCFLIFSIQLLILHVFTFHPSAPDHFRSSLPIMQNVFHSNRVFYDNNTSYRDQPITITNPLNTRAPLASHVFSSACISPRYQVSRIISMNKFKTGVVSLQNHSVRQHFIHFFTPLTYRIIGFCPSLTAACVYYLLLSTTNIRITCDKAVYDVFCCYLANLSLPLPQ